LLRWSYKDKWNYLEDKNYCTMYKFGYTSLGDKHTTNQNVMLCQSIDITTDLPSIEYCHSIYLQNPKYERLSRVNTPTPKYIFKGVVTKGKQFARTLGYPTANIQYFINNNQRLIDYLNCDVEGSIYPAVVGLKSIPGTWYVYWEYIGMVYIHDNTVEVNIFDLDLNEYPSLYTKNINIMIFDKTRDNIKCNGIEELKNLLTNDKQTIKNFFTFLNI
jgi:hypothetical protein